MLSEKVIPPKGEGEIKVTYSAGKRKGKQSKSIQVVSNDPVHPTLSLKVEGEVKEAVVCTPNRVNFGNVIQGESATRQVVVTPGEGEKAKVKNVSINNEHLTATFKKSKEQGGYAVDVALSPEAPRGRINAQLNIETDNENAKLVTINVMATVTGDIVATPERLTLIIQKGEENTGSVLSIEKVRGEDLQITKVESRPDYITTNLETVTEGKLYKIAVNSTAEAAIGRGDGSVVIHTNDPQEPRVEVPLSITVRGNLTIVPEQLSFGVVNQGKAVTKTISLTTRLEELKVRKVETESEGNILKAEVNKQDDKQRSMITVTLNKDVPIGPIQGKVILHTNDPLQPKIEIEVNGRVRAAPST